VGKSEGPFGKPILLCTGGGNTAGTKGDPGKISHETNMEGKAFHVCVNVMKDGATSGKGPL